MSFLGRITGLGRALIARGLGGSGGGAPPVSSPVVSVCGDTVVGRISRGRTAIAADVTGACIVGLASKASTRVAPTIAGRTPVSIC